MNLIPFADVSVPTAKVGDKTALEHFLEGWELWKELGCEEVWLLTRPDALRALYPLYDSIPGLTLGIKTSALIPGCEGKDTRPYDFADAGAWEQITKIAREMAVHNPWQQVMLCNEGAMLPIHQGEATVHPARLRAALVSLSECPGDIIVNLPAILPNTQDAPKRRAITADIVNVFHDALEPDFLTGYGMYPRYRTYPERQSCQQEMERLVNHTIPRLCLSPTVPGWYRPVQGILEAVRLGCEDVSVWTGQADWVETPRTLLEILA